jgi:hypothetical protein
MPCAADDVSAGHIARSCSASARVDGGGERLGGGEPEGRRVRASGNAASEPARADACERDTPGVSLMPAVLVAAAVRRLSSEADAAASVEVGEMGDAGVERGIMVGVSAWRACCPRSKTLTVPR